MPFKHLDDEPRLQECLPGHVRFSWSVNEMFAQAAVERGIQTIDKDSGTDHGVAYQAQGDYCRAIDCFGQTMASFAGARRRECFGQVIPPAVSSRAYLAWCHADLSVAIELYQAMDMTFWLPETEAARPSGGRQ